MTEEKQDIIQSYGLCDNRDRHEHHVFLSNEYETHRSFQDCPGVYVDCLNCDDRKCMDCVFRYQHDKCEDSCPSCGSTCGSDGLTDVERAEMAVASEMSQGPSARSRQLLAEWRKRRMDGA